MNVRLFGCGKFSWLSSESLDRNLTEREMRFMEKHRAACHECAFEEKQGALALNMLRQASLEADSTPHFDERVLRLHRIRSVRASLGYWSPAVLGATIAVIAVLAGLQLVANSGRLPVFGGVGAETRRLDPDVPKFPTIDLSRLIESVRE
jgi:hypothetical protein